VSLYRLGDSAPEIARSAYVAPSATVIGRVTLGENCSVWPSAVIRGDNATIVIGAGSNVQDGAVLHTDPGFPLRVGAQVTIGHQATLHGCSVGEGALIGIGAVVLNGAVIGKACLVGAGAVVTERKVFADGSLILGAPAKWVRALSTEEQTRLLQSAAVYVRRAAQYKLELKRIDEDC
jgi:carbonic anhydrase/acetyltransferase-like protein (isoleucine patch superfamily)